MINKIEKKHMKIVDLVLVVGSILILLGVSGYYLGGIGQQPVSLSPRDGFQTENRFVLFEFENAEIILIDDNTEFTSPEKYNVVNNFVINLEPGVYYWKLEGQGEGKIRQFTIESEVSLKLRDKGEGKYEIVNVGNENLDVDVYEFGKLKENINLDVYSEKKVSGDIENSGNYSTNSQNSLMDNSEKQILTNRIIHKFIGRKNG